MSEEKKLIYINPYLKEEGDDDKDPEYKVTFKNGVEPDTIYVHNTQFRVESHRKRPMVRVTLDGGSTIIVRKVAGKNALKKKEVCFDSLSLKEVVNGAQLEKKKEIKIRVKEANWWDRYYRYFKHHPKDDIRLAYNLFLISVFIGLLSIVLGVWGVLLGYGICGK